MTTRGNPSLKKIKPLSEAHIAATCTEWLALDGWRAIETDPKHLRGLGVSEPGMADRIYIRYDPANIDPSVGFTPCFAAGKGLRNLPDGSFAEECNVMFIEWKKKGGKAGQHQKEWHTRERSRGALTLIAGEDFPASIEGFCGWYQKSGLMRKSISIPK